MSSLAQVIMRIYSLAAVTDGSPTVLPTVPGAEATPTALTIAPTSAPTAVVLSPWNPTQWFARTGWTPSFHTIFLVLSILVAVAALAAYLYFFQRRFKNHTLNARLAERVSMVLTGFASGGLLLMLFAFGQLQLLSWPIWLILGFIALVAVVVYGVYYSVNVYPARLAQYNQELERAKYLPKGRTKGPAYTPPMKRKLKQGKQEKQKK
jgi:amino acid transporter